MMRVTVKLFASFRTGREPTAIRDYIAGTTVGDVVTELKIPAELIGVMLINSRHVKITQELADGDTLALSR